MNWLAPEIEVTIGDRSRLASVGRMEVTAARGQPVATAYLELSNVRFEWEGGAQDGDRLVLRWGYRGEELQPLFDGTVLLAHAREIINVTGLCRARTLADTRVTRTYQEETADAVVAHLVADLGFESLDLAPCDLVIDKLPLHDDTVVSALEWLDRRLALGRAFWADPEGTFHWQPPDEAQDPAATFQHGEDVLSWQLLPGNRRLLTVMGTPLWHSQVVEVIERDGTATRYFLEQVRHTAGVAGTGLRTMLWLREVAP
jgi:hypothetical protein